MDDFLKFFDVLKLYKEFYLRFGLLILFKIDGILWYMLESY